MSAGEEGTGASARADELVVEVPHPQPERRGNALGLAGPAVGRLVVPEERQGTPAAAVDHASDKVQKTRVYPRVEPSRGRTRSPPREASSARLVQIRERRRPPRRRGRRQGGRGGVGSLVGGRKHADQQEIPVGNRVKRPRRGRLRARPASSVPPTRSPAAPAPAGVGTEALEDGLDPLPRVGRAPPRPAPTAVHADRADAVPPHGLLPVPIPSLLVSFPLYAAAAAAAAAALDLDDQRGGPPGRPSNGPRDQLARQLAPQTPTPSARKRDDKRHLDVSAEDSLPGRRPNQGSRQEPRVVEIPQARHLEAGGGPARLVVVHGFVVVQLVQLVQLVVGEHGASKRVDLVRINRSRDCVSLVVGQLGDGATRKDEPSSRSRRRTAAPNGTADPRAARRRRRRGTERGRLRPIDRVGGDAKGTRAEFRLRAGVFPGSDLPVGFRVDATDADSRRSSRVASVSNLRRRSEQPREGRRRCPVHSRGFTAVSRHRGPESLGHAPVLGACAEHGLPQLSEQRGGSVPDVWGRRQRVDPVPARVPRGDGSILTRSRPRRTLHGRSSHPGTFGPPPRNLPPTTRPPRLSGSSFPPRFELLPRGRRRGPAARALSRLGRSGLVRRARRAALPFVVSSLERVRVRVHGREERRPRRRPRLPPPGFPPSRVPSFPISSPPHSVRTRGSGIITGTLRVGSNRCLDRTGGGAGSTRGFTACLKPVRTLHATATHVGTTELPTVLHRSICRATPRATCDPALQPPPPPPPPAASPPPPRHDAQRSCGRRCTATSTTSPSRQVHPTGRPMSHSENAGLRWSLGSAGSA